MSAKELNQWQESEPQRLDLAADQWERAACAPDAKLLWLTDLAAEARKAAANLRAMRSARMRLRLGL